MPDPQSASWQSSLTALLDSITTTDILLMGCDADLLQQIGAGRARQTLALDTPETWQEALPETRRVDCVVLVGLLEKMDKQEGLHLLARLRDIHAHQLILAVPVGEQADKSQWFQTDLLGMGMKMHSRHHTSNKSVHIYTYSIDTYKPAPDWLNSRFWANPNLFGKFRW